MKIISCEFKNISSLNLKIMKRKGIIKQLIMENIKLDFSWGY